MAGHMHQAFIAAIRYMDSMEGVPPIKKDLSFQVELLNPFDNPGLHAIAEGRTTHTFPLHLGRLTEGRACRMSRGRYKEEDPSRN